MKRSCSYDGRGKALTKEKEALKMIESLKDYAFSQEGGLHYQLLLNFETHFRNSWLKNLEKRPQTKIATFFNDLTQSVLIQL